MKTRDPMTVQAMLLQALSLERGFGGELSERILKRTDGRVAIRQGSLYPALSDLEERGWIAKCEGEQRATAGGRPRQYYKLTTKGRMIAMRDRAAVSGIIGATE